MNDALARHLVDERDGILQRALRTGEVVAIDGCADAPQGVSQPSSELTVLFAILETLTMRFQRRFMRSHVIDYLQNH